jgi:hypothetical protein
MNSFLAYTSNLLEGFQKETSRAKAALEEELIQRELTKMPPSGDARFCEVYQRADVTIEGQSVSSGECESLRAELEVLREYPSRFRQLEQENASLRSKLERAANRRPHTPKRQNGTRPATAVFTSESEDGRTSEDPRQSLVKPINPGHEKAQLRSLLGEKERAYASLMEKHLKMTHKFRQLKESTKSWQAYHEKSVAKSAQLKAMGKGTGGNTKDELLCGIITPDPSCPTPLGLATSPKGPRDITGRSFDSSSGASRHSVARSSPQSGPVGATLHGYLTAQAADQTVLLHENAHKEVPSKEPREPPSELSEPSSTQSITSPLANQLRQQKLMPCLGNIDDDSDSPVVVTERTLKRKRLDEPTATEFMIHDDAPTAVGSFRKPVQVKSEEGSSPTTPAYSRSLDLVHDSLDLDEVGARNFTPRKRKATYALGLMGTSGKQPKSPREQHNSDFIRPNNPNGITRNSVAGPENDAYYTQLVQRLGAKLWEEQLQKEAKRQIDQEGLDAQVPGHLRGVQNSKLARQYLHNQKAHARQMRAPEVHTRPEDLMQPNRDTGKKSGTGDGGNATSGPQAAAAVRTPAHDVLQPMTPNVQLLPRTSDVQYDHEKCKLHRRYSGSAAVPNLAEDGEGNPQQTVSTRIKAPALDKLRQSPMGDEVHRRLGGLLNGPTPGKLPLLASGGLSMAVTPRTSVKRTSRNAEASPITRDVTGQNLYTAHKTIKVPSGNVGQETSRPRSSTPATRSSHTAEARKATLPHKGRLRDRPVHQLHSDDFKINPAANHGLDFAYSEVVRTRDQRKCLPNCTKPECCGDKFNKMVRIGGFGLPGQGGLWDSSPVDEQEANIRLISEHFGLNAKQIKKLPGEEQNRLADKAKADRFANEYGKHRHVHERAPSPPGFWRTEMPTTQELEADRELGKEEERRKVEGRYMEATREGGRWMFRDE